MTTTAAAAPPAAPPDILRTARSGCWKVRNGSLGQYLVPVDDPLANVEISKDQTEAFKLREDFIKIPGELWSRWILLCLDLSKSSTGTLEVSCRLLRRENDPSQWRILVPPQDVCTASVRVDTFDGSVDIETGEVIESYPPQGWIPMGSSHSHNTMTLDRFSSIDDHAELGDPGVHILISHCSTAGEAYRWKQTDSVVAAQRRFYLPQDQDSLTENFTVLQSYHQAARSQVVNLQERSRSALASATPSWGTQSTSNFTDSWQEDPFFWSDSPQLLATASRESASDGEKLLALYSADLAGLDECWDEQLDILLVGIQDSINRCCWEGNQAGAASILENLSRLSRGDIPSPLQWLSHVDPQDPARRPA